jgi:hypothetical protein
VINAYPHPIMTEGNHNILNLDKMMTESQIILAFRDTINQDTLDGLYSIAEWRMETLESERSVKKRIFNILIECSQNIVKHSTEEHGKYGPLVALAKQGDTFVIIASNPIATDSIQDLKDKIDKINNVDPADMRQFYTESLMKSEFSSKGGAGLGLLDIYKKSGSKLEYNIQTVEDGSAMLTLTVRVAPKAH